VPRQATIGNAEPRALSGPRNPLPRATWHVGGRSRCRLILVDGNPVADNSLIARPRETFVAIITG